MMNDLNVTFIGGLFPKEIENEIYKKSVGNIQTAANIHQWNIIKGLDYVLKRPVTIINIPFIGSYPKRYKDLFVKRFCFSHTDGANDINLGFLNLTLIKKIHRKIVLKSEVKKWLKKNKNKKTVVIMYSVQSLFFDIAKLIKRIDNTIHICLIVPDLPIYMDIDKEEKILYKLLTKYTSYKALKQIETFDSYVLLTKHMKDYFNIKKPYVVIEGMINAAEDSTHESKQIENVSDEEIKYIAYTGTLAKKYGVMDLVKAFISIKNSNYRLIVCGDGGARKEIEDCSKNDNRIIFKGSVNREEALKIQRNATLHVNPRRADEEYTKYSFPSKILEYMLAGKPVLCHKLKGIPNDYDEYLLYFNSTDIKKMSDRIVEICEINSKEREYIGKRAKNYVLNEKNSSKRALEIVKMVSVY